MLEGIQSFIKRKSWRGLPTDWGAAGRLFYGIIAASFIIGFLLGGGWNLWPDTASNLEALNTPPIKSLDAREPSVAPAVQTSEDTTPEPPPIAPRSRPSVTRLSPSLLSGDDMAWLSDLTPDDEVKTGAGSANGDFTPFQTASTQEDHHAINTEGREHRAPQAQQAVVKTTSNHTLKPDNSDESRVQNGVGPSRAPVRSLVHPKTPWAALMQNGDAKGQLSPSDPVYALQVGAFLEKANADNTASNLRAKGYDPFVLLQRGAKERVWHRVFIKRSTGRAQAQAAAAVVEASEQIDVYVQRLDTLQPSNDNSVR